MFRAINTAASGMSAQEKHVSTIANNIANANTVGFKKSRTEFEDLLYETLKNPGSRSSETTLYNVGTQIGHGARVAAVRRINTQGSPLITNNPFDMMINGEGLFGLIQPNNEIAYTRDGSFNVDQAGNIVNKDGSRLYPGFTVPPNTISVNISNNGLLETYVKGEIEPQNLGNIPVFTFTNPVGLKAIGQNLLVQTSSSGVPIQNIAGQGNAGSIEQGRLEASNVEIMNEMTNMIRAQRAYETNAKVMGVADSMLETMNSIRR